MSLDVDRIAAAVVGLMKSSLHGLTARVARLEQQAPVPGPPGERGDRGERGERGESGLDGLHGKDGRDADEARIDGVRADVALLREDFAILQVEQRREVVGPPGRDGKDADETTIKDLREALAALRQSFETLALEHLQHHVIVGPPGRDGTNGVDGKDGQDAVSIASALIDRDGHLRLSFTDGMIRDAGHIVGEKGEKGIDGKDGRDGVDGMGFEDLSFEYDDQGRGWAVFRRGDTVKRFHLSGAHQGVWKADGVYLRGDSVSWGGSSWMAMVDTPPGKPETAHSGWLLTVQRGREGKPGLAGAEGKQGKDGKDGVERRWPA